MKQLSIIGPTASGKSDLAIKIALKINAYILSIDSLSIYKEIDIVSAKPSQDDLSRVKHFGIDVLYPNEYFSVEVFISLYEDAIKECKKDLKNLIIVGGTSFYLKSLLQGLSKLPEINQKVKDIVNSRLLDLDSSYKFLVGIDPEYMSKISKNDRYRVEKALLIYEASQMSPTKWFQQNPPKAIIEDLDIFSIDVDRDILRDRISKRTANMFKMGLVDEVCKLEKKYTRLPNAMKSIGVVEVLEYLDFKVTKEKMLQNISIHTSQLAKRQQTFNKTQFENITLAPLEDLEDIILQRYEDV